ncbi:MAG: DUF2252 domain-containing protein [Geminicoccaceae bacterium]
MATASIAPTGRQARRHHRQSPRNGAETSPPAAAKGGKPHVPAEALKAAGQALRERLPRQEQAKFRRDKAAVDPLAILRAADKGRLENLLPIRYGRMLQSPFTFYRGSAAVMAADLAQTPSTGLRVQACGDCHLLNFGGFATPERNILFDINDFDETSPAPWEWDVKRLVASFVLAARSQGIPDARGRAAAVACARSYRERLRDYAEMSPLDVWYARINDEDLVELAGSQKTKARIRERVAAATSRDSSESVFPQLAGMVGGKIQIRDQPPLIYHPAEIAADEFQARIEDSLQTYRATLSDDRRDLLDQYRLVDGAVKVVGIGSVGTLCLVILLMSAANDPLFLQWKEARTSVLEPFAGASAYAHHGQRVVMGQRLMQPASDVFLGWATTQAGRPGYVRQLRDAKIKPLVEAMDAELLEQYALACGWVLARAHAKAGSNELSIAGYLGSKDRFDEAMGDFALAYADQAERDHAALKAAVRAGKIKVMLEE